MSYNLEFIDKDSVSQYVTYNTTGKINVKTPAGSYTLGGRNNFNAKFYVYGKVPCLFHRICMKLFFGFEWKEYIEL